MTASRAVLLASASASDPNFSSVVQLAHFNGSNLSTTFTNSCSRGNTLTVFNGVATIITAQSKYGGASLQNNASSGISNSATIADYTFGTGDWTIEFWHRMTAYTSSLALLDMRPSSTNGLYPTIRYDSTGAVYYFVNNANVITSSASALSSSGSWDAICACKVSGTTRLFVNGVQVGSSYTDSNSYAAGALWVGMGSFSTYSTNVEGYDELRITKGVGRYSSNYTPATVAFPNH